MFALTVGGGADLSQDMYREISAHMDDDDRVYLQDLVQKGRIRLLDESSEIVNFKPTPEHVKNGYAVFVRPYDERITAKSTPKPAELTAELKSFTGKNTYKVMTFCVYPLVELGDVDVKVGDLKTKTGDIIAKSNIEARWGQYLIRPVDYGLKSTFYRVAETLLNKLPMQGKLGITRRIWLQLSIPAAAKAGDYEAPVTIKPKALPATTITLKLKVMPFVLEVAPNLSVGFYYAVPKNPAWFNEEFQDYSRHGFTSANTSGGKSGKTSFNDYTLLNEYYKVAKKNKLTGLQFVMQPSSVMGKPGSDGAMANAKQAIADLSDEWFSEHEGADKYVYFVTDEPRQVNDTGYNLNFSQTMELVDYCEKFKDMKTCVTIMTDSDWADKKIDYVPMAQKLDYIMTHHWKKSASIIEVAKKKNGYIMYNSSRNRFGYGFHLWRSGAMGKMEWHYRWEQPNIFMPQYEQWAVTYRDRNNFMSTPEFEKCAEGVSDYKYLYTLEKKIKANENSADPEIKKKASEAFKFLRDLKSKIIDLPDVLHGEDYMSFRDMDSYRLKIAEYLSVLP